MSKAYCLCHSQTKILVSKGVLFVEDVQLLLSCTKETNLHSWDMYDTLLPLFHGAHPIIEKLDAQVETQNQTTQVHDLKIDDVCVNNVVYDKTQENLDSRSMPKWIDNPFVLSSWFERSPCILCI